MKKNLLSILALLCAAAALAVSIYTCISVNSLISAQNEKIDAFLAAAATEPAHQDTSRVSIESWQLEPRVWDDGNGADVVFTAMLDVPSDDTVYLDVQLNGQDVGFYPCSHNSVGYTATAALTAENGYSYTCVVSHADGTNDVYPLASPDNPTNYQVVNLKDSLSTYCNLLVGDWTLKNGSLFISGYAQAQLPQIGSDPVAPAAALCLLHNGEPLQRCDIALLPGEGSGSFEGELNSFDFDPLPVLQEDDTLELWLEVSIGTQTMSVCGAEWHLENGELMLVAG